MSFGGGMSGWVRREVVQRRSWLDDAQFLSGVAISQIAPGPNGVNLAISVGTVLRGSAGALAALAGLLAVPLVAVIAAGLAYARLHRVAEAPPVAPVLAGMGAAAIGLNLATGVRLAGRNVRDLPGAGIAVATALGIGAFRLNLLLVLTVMIPASLGLLLLRRR
jgi:chromate transporter